VVKGSKREGVGPGELGLTISCRVKGSMILVAGSRTVDRDNSSGASWKSSSWEVCEWDLLGGLAERE
jgi:hypothetical protein